MAEYTIPPNTNNPQANTPSVNNSDVNTPTPFSITAPLTDSITPTSQPLSIPRFGYYTSESNNLPNDSLVLDVYSANNQYIETKNRANYIILNGTKIQISPEIDLSSLGYISGKYKLTYKYHRNLLGSADRSKLQVQEISANRLEMRVVAAIAENPATENADFFKYFYTDFFNLPKKETLVNLFLHVNATTALKVYDYVLDDITFKKAPHSIIFKLTSPAPIDIENGTKLWLAQQVNESTTDTITLVPPPIPNITVSIAGPNFDILTKQRVLSTTEYKDWEDILSDNTNTSEALVNSLLSGSKLEGIPLNIDYRSFSNHVHFGSATEKLHSFKYKMNLLENYDSRIQSLTTNLIGSPSSSVTSSLYFQTNVIDAKQKKATLLGAMDGYENYLLKESSSYESSSYGEFYTSTWPKQNNTKPYLNYSVSSSQVEDWFDGIIMSASLYDQNNENALNKTIPLHIGDDAANSQYVLFVNMIGHYFDASFPYIQQLNQTHDRKEGIADGFSKELIYHIAKNLGLDFENGASFDELWNYTLGTNTSGSYQSTYNITNEDKTKEIWKRIINNLPYLLKTKGTERGLRALINCFGIPQTILRIREYGGAEPTFESKTDNVYERFFYSTTVGYNGKTSGQVAQLIEAPWKPLTANNTMPSTVELRVKMAQNQTKTQTIFEVPNKWQVKAFQSASNNYIGFFLSGSQGYATASVSSSIYENVFHHIALERSVASDSSSTNQTYTLIVKRVNYLKVTSTVSASLYIDGSTSSSYNTSYTSTGSLWIPGSGSFLAATSQSMNILSGSVQELKYWTTPLQDAILDNHALAPTSFQGNLTDTHTGSTSSFYSLGFRLCLGTDNKKTNLATTSSIGSQHPDQTIAGLSGSFYNFSGSYFNPVIEIHSLEWPDLGGNRSISNKVRIDTTSRTSTAIGGNQLYKNVKTERAGSDSNPPDSPRLGIYLSPLNEINQDIAEQFGGLSIDDFIGNPSDLSKETYPDLESLQREYTKKYTSKAGAQNYIRLLKHYDASLFRLIKKFVPYRANTQTGLLIEPSILHRSKVPTKQITYTDLSSAYTSSIKLPEIILVTGSNSDGGKTSYIEVGTVQIEAKNLIGESIQVATGTQTLNVISVGGTANDYTNTGLSQTPAGTIDFGISSYGRDTRVRGSQYVFMTHMVSQSAFVSYYGASTYDTTYVYSTDGIALSQLYMVTASRYDYHDPINPVIIDSAGSSITNVQNKKYNNNIFYLRSIADPNTYGSVSASAKTIYTSSVALYENNWTSKYGLKVETLVTNNVLQSTPYTNSAFWGLTGSLGLFFENTTTPIAYTGSVKLPAFYYKEDEPKTHGHLYTITVVVGDTRASGTSGKIELHFGDLDCILTGSMVPTNTDTTYTFTTLATGPWLGLRVYTAGQTAYQTYIKSLKIQPLNYRSQTQDFHLQNSIGMLNARYNGCKLTSADWNTNSSDTIDNGPVVSVTVGGGQQLKVKTAPNKGNFQVTKTSIAAGQQDVLG
jgi:hypothetical protein